MPPAISIRACCTCQLGSFTFFNLEHLHASASAVCQSVVTADIPASKVESAPATNVKDQLGQLAIECLASLPWIGIFQLPYSCITWDECMSLNYLEPFSIVALSIYLQTNILLELREQMQQLIVEKREYHLYPSRAMTHGCPRITIVI